MKTYPHHPILEIGNRRGTTGYIDFIRKNELVAPVMKGMDRYSRPFIVFSGTISGKATSEDTQEHYTFLYPFMQTVFQRYTDVPSLWTGCGHGDRNLIHTSGGMSVSQRQLIHHLIAETQDETFIDLNVNLCMVKPIDFSLVSKRYKTDTGYDTITIEGVDIIDDLRLNVPNTTLSAKIVLHCPIL